MRRLFDLSVEHTSLAKLLNDPKFEIEEIDVSCTKEGYVTALIRYSPTRFPRRNQQWYRKMKRFILVNGEDEELNKLLLRPDCRVIEEYDFKTESGVIIVVHYELRV